MTSHATVNVKLSLIGSFHKTEWNGIQIHFAGHRLELMTPELAKLVAALLADDRQKRQIDDVCSALGLDFALIVVSCHRAFLACGPRSSFRLFYRFAGAGLIVSDSLIEQGDRHLDLHSIDFDYLKSFLAAAYATGPFEIFADDRCALKEWRAVRNGTCCEFDPGNGRITSVRFDNVYAGLDLIEPSLSQAEEMARAAFARHIESFAIRGAIAAELSGGIDSGLVCSQAARTLGVNFLGGVTLDYPFYEFERERFFRGRLRAHLGVAGSAIPADTLLPFSGLLDVPSHDEPSVNSTSWAQFDAVTERASRLGAGCLLTGHGGDVVFLSHPETPVRVSHDSTDFHVLKTALRRELVERATHAVDQVNRSMPTGMGGAWHPSMLDTGFPGRHCQARSNALIYCSGLISVEFLRALAYVWRAGPAIPPGAQKPIAHLLFSDHLPAEVWSRPGKVDHLGLVYRGAKSAARQILWLIDTHAELLEALGVSAARYRDAALGATRGSGAGSRLLSQILSVLIWAHSAGRDIELEPLTLDRRLPS